MNTRFLAVQHSMRKIQALIASADQNMPLDQIKQELERLASKTELFPKEDFTPRAGTVGGLYELMINPDTGLALYAAAGKKDKYQPPHNHTVWAIICSVYGNEINTFYERTDDGSVLGQGALRVTHKLDLKPGHAISLGPEQIHSIHVESEEPTLHLHLYGKPLDTLVDRIGFSAPQGGQYKRFMAQPLTYAPWVSAADLHDMLNDRQEIALLDVRTALDYVQGHLFYAASLPLDRFDADLATLVPNSSTRIVLIDSHGLADAEAERAATLAHRLGYYNVAVLKGGVHAWTGPIYGGVFTPSKAFGEVAEHYFQLEGVSPEELSIMTPRPLLLDARTKEEFEHVTIPGSLSCPGGELLKRAVSYPGPIVVNCAGRTRSIMGALTLRLAGHSQVWPLKNGVMGQALAGFPLLYGSHAALNYTGDLTLAQERTAALRAKYKIQNIELGQVASLSGTYYLLDVRDPADYAAGHIPGSRNAPGGQLVQQTDMWCPVLGATLVLIDTDGLTSITTAIWLSLMGWDVVTLKAQPLDFEVPRQPAHTSLPQGVPIYEVGSSRDYRNGHVPGAVWVKRNDLVAILSKATDKRAGITSKNPRLAQCVANELKTLGYSTYIVNRTTITKANPQLLSTPDDVWYPPQERTENVEQAMHEYLAWETGLLEQIRTDPHVRFLIQA